MPGKKQPPPAGACLLGSVAPDIALYLLSLGGALHFRYILGWSAEATWRHLFDTLYFHNHFWIAAHNLLHSPTVLVIGLVVLWRLEGLAQAPRRWLGWFLAACLLHSFVDVLTHVDDGPLLFFPFEWTVRFESPVSYWDSRHYGNQFAVFELTLGRVSPGLPVPAAPVADGARTPGAGAAIAAGRRLGLVEIQTPLYRVIWFRSPIPVR